MTKEVLTFTLNPDKAPLCQAHIPGDAVVLSAREQGDAICVWALADPEHERKPKEFALMGAGHEMPEFGERKTRFVGSANMQGGLVFHVFEVLD